LENGLIRFRDQLLEGVKEEMKNDGIDEKSMIEAVYSICVLRVSNNSKFVRAERKKLKAQDDQSGHVNESPRSFLPSAVPLVVTKAVPSGDTSNE
jgi:tRNA A37 threonylcarbamoyladenosine dehydratase